MRTVACALLLCCIALAGCSRPGLDTQSTVATAEVQGASGRDIVPGNEPPSTVLQATPLRGVAPLAVVFGLSARDTEGDALTYTLDPGDGSAVLEGATLPIAFKHDYAAGRHLVVLTVTDGKESTRASLTIDVQPSPVAPPPPSGVGAGGGGGGYNPPPSSSTTTTTSSETPSTSSSNSTSCSPSGDKHPKEECSSSTSQSDSASSSSSNSTTVSQTSTSTGSTSSTQTSTSSSSTTSTSSTMTSTSSTTTTTSSSTSTTTQSNHAPAASLAPSTPNGTAPVTVQYHVDASDADGDALSWTLDVDGDGTLDANGTAADLPATVDHTFDQPGTYAALLTVSDGQDVATATTTVAVQ